MVAYAIARRLVLWCDPSLAADLSMLADPAQTKSLDDLESWAPSRGWELLSRGYMQLLSSGGVVPPARDDGFEIRSLDRDDAQDRALVDAFKTTLSEADRDEADLDEPELDEHIVVMVDGDGIAAYASQQPFDYADGFADIAVATRPDVRGRGLGRLVVARLCTEIEDRGLFPLYRCDAVNLASVRLSASLGFVTVVEVGALTRP